MPGISENIHVRSIVGNFLEHSRIFYFGNSGSDEIFMGSADWMPRNLDRRVEIVFPVEDEEIKKEIRHVLDLEFRDNVKAHILQPDGTYVKPDKRGKTLLNSQMEFCKEATEKAHALKKKEKEKIPEYLSRQNRQRILKNKKMAANSEKMISQLSFFIYAQKNFRITSEVSSSQYENRTRVFAVRGRRLNPLTNWPCKQYT